MPRTSVLVIGDIATDTVVRVQGNGDVAANADTDSLIVDSPGGQGGNTARWIAAAGTSVYLLATVSVHDDVARLERDLRADGVIPLLQPVDAVAARVISVLSDDRSERSFFTQRGAAGELDSTHIDAVDLTDIGWIHISGYLLSNDKGQRCYARIHQRAAELDIPVSLDPASLSVIKDLGIEGWKVVVSHVALLLPNADEARLLAGQADLTAAATQLIGLADMVIVTNGEHGAIVTTENECFGTDAEAIPAVGVVDPTGAGDAFAAGVIAALSQSRSLREAASAGGALGARCVRQLGAHPTSLPFADSTRVTQSDPR
jgi:sugar/nucleoside kinase (ribokinase family)